MYKAIRTGRHGFHILCFFKGVYRNERVGSAAGVVQDTLRMGYLKRVFETNRNNSQLLLIREIKLIRALTRTLAFCFSSADWFLEGGSFFFYRINQQKQKKEKCVHSSEVMPSPVLSTSFIFLSVFFCTSSRKLASCGTINHHFIHFWFIIITYRYMHGTKPFQTLD